jgi:V/A-type H+-transporting ATPase subunit E
MSTDGVQRIIQEINKSTDEKVSEIISEAKKKVETILNDAKQKADEQDRLIVARGNQEAQRESQRILAEARIKARREKVKAQEEVVQKSFDRAQDILKKISELRNANGISYKDVLETLIRESVVSAGIGSMEVLVNPHDSNLLSEEVLSRIARETEDELGIKVSLAYSEEPLLCMGGVMIRSMDGKVRVDNTFETRIERFRESVRTQVAKELFSRISKDG